MSDFRSPIEDITFTLRHVADLDALAKLEGYEHADPDLIDGLVAEAGRFFDEVVAPTNRDGDTVGTKLNEDGSITTAPVSPRPTASSSSPAGTASGSLRPTAAAGSHSCSPQPSRR